MRDDETSECEARDAGRGAGRVMRGPAWGCGLRGCGRTGPGREARSRPIVMPSKATDLLFPSTASTAPPRGPRPARLEARDPHSAPHMRKHSLRATRPGVALRPIDRSSRRTALPDHRSTDSFDNRDFISASPRSVDQKTVFALAGRSNAQGARAFDGVMRKLPSPLPQISVWSQPFTDSVISSMLRAPGTVSLLARFRAAESS